MAKSTKSKMPWAEIGTAAFAATLGGIIGVLFAPQSGKKTRKAIADEGKKLAKETAKLAAVAKSEVTKALPKKAVKKVAKKKK